MKTLQSVRAQIYMSTIFKSTRKEVRSGLSEVHVGEHETIESALRRFKKKIQKAGILSEIKRRERYEKPSLKKKRKAEAAKKRRDR
jgi:small subunit ribosomal protein S21